MRSLSCRSHHPVPAGRPQEERIAGSGLAGGSSADANNLSSATGKLLRGFGILLRKFGMPKILEFQSR